MSGYSESTSWRELGQETESELLVTDILSEIRPALTSLREFTEGKSRGPYATQNRIEEMEMRSSTQIRWNRADWQLRRRFIAAVAGLALLKDGEADEQIDYVDELIEMHMDGAFSDPDLKDLPVAAKSAVEINRRLMGYATDLIPKIRRNTQREQFELMKLLARTYTGPEPSLEESEVESIQILYLFNEFTQKGRSSKLEVQEKLEQGEFDYLIAQELLQTAIGVEKVADNNQAEQDLVRLFNLAHILAPGSSPADIIKKLTVPSALEVWPSGCKASLAMHRAQYSQDLRKTIKDIYEYLEGNNCLVPQNLTETDLEQAADDLIEMIAKQRSANTELGVKERLAARVALESTKKKRRARVGKTQEIGSLATGVALSARQEAQMEPRKLAYVRPDGSLAPQGSIDYKNIFEDYVNEHPDQTGLQADLEKVEQYLQTIDLSAGLPRGLYKITGGENIPRGERRLRKVYQLKPVEAIGLSMSSAISAKIRVVFTLENGTVGVLGIADRDKLRPLFRSIGIKGRDRRK